MELITIPDDKLGLDDKQRLKDLALLRAGLFDRGTQEGI
jgi:hypothetical protein